MGSVGPVANPLKQRPLLPEAHWVFQFQQFPFHVEAVEIALQVAAFGDDPVARHDDGNGVVAVGLADGPHTVRVAEGMGYGEVGGGMAIRDFQQLPPHGLMELGTFLKVERQVEFLPVALEMAR